jgi:pyridoxal phosphate enzyme (YggS family)
MSVAQNLETVRKGIQGAMARCGRHDGVRLVAVTKTVCPESILEAIALGVTDIGENRVQEAVSKYPAIGPKVRWHLIGHLQTNKVKRAAELFDVIQTVDSHDLASRLHRACIEIGRESLDVMIQVNVDDDPAKSGILPADVPELARYAGSLNSLRVRGLMTIGRQADNLDDARNTFSSLVKLAREIDTMSIPNVSMTELSMGMSGDYEIAIEEGSTLVRVGSAIFGARD